MELKAPERKADCCRSLAFFVATVHRERLSALRYTRNIASRIAFTELFVESE